jgi:hypothetical protein
MVDEISAHNRVQFHTLRAPTSAVRVSGGAGRSCTVRNLGPGDARQGAPANSGSVSSWSPLAVGAQVGVSAGAAVVIELLDDAVTDCVLGFSYP